MKFIMDMDEQIFLLSEGAMEFQCDEEVEIKSFRYFKKINVGNFYKSPRRGVTINNTVQAVRRSAVIVKM